ncbi:MAG: hypothetical protein ACJAS4_000106 [Bacteriovoracaceae bacterium]|jgi:hypothetical protein
MIRPLLVLSLTATSVFANTGTELLLKQKNTLNLKTNYSKVKQAINLDDTFLVQAYGAMRALRVGDIGIQDYFDAIFNKDFKAAINLYSNLKTNNKEEERLLTASRLYVLWKLKLNQSFFNAWLEESNNYDFLNSELGVALDQIISVNPSNWLLTKSIFISKAQLKLVDNIAKSESSFNFSVQAYRNLRKGEEGLVWIQYLKPQDPLRELLAKSAILDFSRKGQLGDAAKIVKEVLEPVLSKTDDLEKISEYYLLLARLLYQAKAYEASERYYSLIPDESMRFLQARVELLWISMRTDDHSVILGELKSLELSIFNEKFLPEVFLVSSMANLQLCQFSKVQDSFNQFIKNNKEFAKELSENLGSESPKQLDQKNGYINRLANSLKYQKNEIKAITSTILEKEESDAYISKLQKDESEIILLKNKEIKQEWKNRQRILEATLRRMRFVKIEFLSKMRRLNGTLANSSEDSVSTLTSAIDKTDKLEFPHDGVIFGDELFHYTSRIKNLCLQGRNK